MNSAPPPSASEDLLPGASSVVVLARDINQSIFKPLWLLEQGIVLKGEINDENTVYAPGITKISGDGFDFLVLPDRLQMMFAPACRAPDVALMRVLGGLSKLLPHTPFMAVGLNYQYELSPTSPESFFEWDKAKFACPWALAQSPKGDSRTRYGCTFAFDEFGARMRVRVAVSAKIQPNQEIPTPVTEVLPYVVQVHCNLHRDLPKTATSAELSRMLSIWHPVRERTKELVRSLLE